jgi:glycine cleavage system H protein
MDISPVNLLYTKDHQWIYQRDGSSLLTLGVTHYFQERMEEIIYIESPPEGVEVEEGEHLFLIESGKTVYEFSSPAKGTIRYVNDQVLETPGFINEDPYGKGWLIKMGVDGTLSQSYFTLSEYEEYISGYRYPEPPVI